MVLSKSKTSILTLIKTRLKKKPTRYNGITPTMVFIPYFFHAIYYLQFISKKKKQLKSR